MLDVLRPPSISERLMRHLRLLQRRLQRPAASSADGGAGGGAHKEAAPPHHRLIVAMVAAGEGGLLTLLADEAFLTSLAALPIPANTLPQDVLTHWSAIRSQARDETRDETDETRDETDGSSAAAPAPPEVLDPRLWSVPFPPIIVAAELGYTQAVGALLRIKVG